MKTIILISAILFSTFSYSQKIAIKLKSVQTITLEAKRTVTMQAETIIADSIIVSDTHDNGHSVIVDLVFYKKGDRIWKAKSLLLWEGEAYKKNQDWTNESVISRIKTLLEIK